MDGWLLDAYRKGEKIVLWVKLLNGKNLRFERSFSCSMYVEDCAESRALLKKLKIRFLATSKQTYLRKEKPVLKIAIPKISSYERFVSDLEKAASHRLAFYDADIPPEYHYIWKHNLLPCAPVTFAGDALLPSEGDDIALSKISMEIIPSGPGDSPIKKLRFGNTWLAGSEEEMLRAFVSKFKDHDPDVIVLERAFYYLPYLEKRLQVYGLSCPFHRWDSLPLKYKGGRSFFTYGTVRYQDYAVRLRGRFLVDSSSMVGDECDADAIAELCRISGIGFQQIASRSFGAAFQGSLVRHMVQNNFLVHFKEKPLDKPLDLFTLLKADASGHRMDPKIGFHKHVAEIDFCSMYPWLIYNENISADTLLSGEEPLRDVPGVPITISHKFKGLVPQAVKPFLDRRMEYKRNPTQLNKSRAMGLKWLLVTCYGYLRFREFKLGIGMAHMAIGAFAREILVNSFRLAEERGFTVLHGIVDSLYITKDGMTAEDVQQFCDALEKEVGIPVTFEGIFKWIVFLPSINDPQRPVPATYYGAFEKGGGIKTRGIEVRQKSAPMIVQQFQQHVLEIMEECDNEGEVVERLPLYCSYLRKLVKKLHTFDSDVLCAKVKISKTSYKNNIPQKRIVEAMQAKGYDVLPGQTIKYVMSERGAVLREDYFGDVDLEYYFSRFVRALFVILQPFGVTRERILSLCLDERQTILPEYKIGLLTELCFEEKETSKPLIHTVFPKDLLRTSMEKVPITSTK